MERNSDENRTYHKRATAFKINISALKEGVFVSKEGFEPSYVDTLYGEISRANLMGVIISKSVLEDSFYMEDHTGRIHVRKGSVDYSNINLDNYNLGDIINIIGKVRSFDDQIYIIPEIIKKIKDNRWLEVRKLELNNLKKVKTRDELKETMEKNHVIKENVEEEQKVNHNEYFENIIKAIKEMDEGDGVNSEDLINKANISDGDKIISKLLEDGEIFEIRPGRIKVLE